MQVNLAIRAADLKGRRHARGIRTDRAQIEVLGNRVILLRHVLEDQAVAPDDRTSAENLIPRRAVRSRLLVAAHVAQNPAQAAGAHDVRFRTAIGGVRSGDPAHIDLIHADGRRRNPGQPGDAAGICGGRRLLAVDFQVGICAVAHGLHVSVAHDQRIRIVHEAEAALDLSFHLDAIELAVATAPEVRPVRIRALPAKEGVLRYVGRNLPAPVRDAVAIITTRCDMAEVDPVLCNRHLRAVSNLQRYAVGLARHAAQLDCVVLNHHILRAQHKSHACRIQLVHAQRAGRAVQNHRTVRAGVLQAVDLHVHIASDDHRL